MLIGKRTLEIQESDAKKDLVIEVEVPIQNETCWSCQYTIHWPEKPVIRQVGGEDALQAALLAFYMIGSDLYMSDAHRNARLTLDGQSGDFGFPVHAALRNQVRGYEEI